jgi:hypothetical protein
MPQVYFTKVSEHTAEISGASTQIWRIRTIASEGVQGGKVFFVKASKVHLTLDKEYWTDSRYLIAENKVRLPQTIDVSEREEPVSQPNDPSVFQQIECGTCERVNLVSIDPAVQGSHQCSQCRGTICIITGKQLVLKNGAKALNTVRGRRV